MEEPDHDAPHLADDRVVLRPWREEEAARVLDIRGRREVMQWLGDDVEHPQLLTSRTEARAWITRVRDSYDRRPLGVWAIVPRSAEVPVGTVLLLTLPDAEAGEVEIGWHLHPDSTGHGWATAAARLVLAHGFAAGLPEIHALTHEDNHASQAVCARLGMRDLGVVERWYDGPSRHFLAVRPGSPNSTAPGGLDERRPG